MNTAGQSAEQEFPFPYHDVFNAVVAIIPVLAGFRLRSHERGTGCITADARAGWLARESLTLLVKANDDDTTLVTIESAMAHGSNQRCARSPSIIFNGVTEVLKLHSRKRQPRAATRSATPTRIPAVVGVNKTPLPLGPRKPNPVMVLVYGFDTIGFDLGDASTHLTESIEVEFCRFANAPRLDQADGVIIPQGIFEKFVDGTPWPSSTTVRVYDQQLRECGWLLTNLLKDSKWVCFLVGAITDFVPFGYGLRQCRDTDLCKRVLNNFGIKRSLITETPCSWTKVSEFEKYFRDYGVARTEFDIPWQERPETRELGEVGETTVAFELFGSLFFLPCYPMRHDKTGANELAETVSSAIVHYRQKREVELPTRVETSDFGLEENWPSEPQEHHE